LRERNISENHEIPYELKANTESELDNVSPKGEGKDKDPESLYAKRADSKGKKGVFEAEKEEDKD